jgi:PAS domain S-box-containing protein
MIAPIDLLEAIPAAIYATDEAGRITFYNQAAAELWGHRPPIGSSHWCGSWRLYWPDGSPLPHDECPMAIALREGRPVRGMNAVAERPDGTRVPFMPYPTPLMDASGRVVGAVNLLVDLSERAGSQIESARLAAIVASSDDAIVSKTLMGEITSWNDGAARMFGYEAEEMIGQPITRIIPPELHDEEVTILDRLRRGVHIQHYETVRMAKGGRRIDISVSVSPLRNAAGEIVGASKVARDITERRVAERSQQLLIDELNHRVKNTLAIVLAIANLSSARARTMAEFVPSFTGRVQALAKAHTLLTETRMQGAELTSLVNEQVILGEDGDERIACSGPSLVLGSQLAVHVAMVLHELATNARKYGALSSGGGRLEVSWEVDGDDRSARRLVLHWQERGGPTVEAPTAQGFGTTLIDQTVRSDGGAIVMRYDPEGLSATITLPLSDQHPTTAELVAAAAAKHQADLRNLTRLGRPTLLGKRIVVIEDEPIEAMDLSAMLTTAGCRVSGAAGTLAQARQLVAEMECDAALLDANLAGEHVGELAATLTRRNIPFAFVTGYSRSALPEGFQDCVLIGKPVIRGQLLAAVEMLFATLPAAPSPAKRG